MDSEVKILLEKEAGSARCRSSIQASSPAAALNGIAILVVDFAKQVQIPVEGVLARLATVLLAPAADNGGAEVMERE